MRAEIDGTMIAEALDDDLIAIEGIFYFPPATVAAAMLRASARPLNCPWRGTGKYFCITIASVTHLDAAWSFPAPPPAAIERVCEDFSGYIAFDESRISIQEQRRTWA